MDFHNLRRDLKNDDINHGFKPNPQNKQQKKLERNIRNYEQSNKQVAPLVKQEQQKSSKKFLSLEKPSDAKVGSQKSIEKSVKELKQDPYVSDAKSSNKTIEKNKSAKQLQSNKSVEKSAASDIKKSVNSEYEGRDSAQSVASVSEKSRKINTQKVDHEQKNNSEVNLKNNQQTEHTPNIAEKTIDVDKDNKGVAQNDDSKLLEKEQETKKVDAVESAIKAPEAMAKDDVTS